jgi:hypothetical protein
MYGSVFGISGILGPALGGMLSNPADLYPSYFSKEGFVGKNPYFLTCMLGALLCIFGLYTTLFVLCENTHKHRYEHCGEEVSDNHSVSIPLRDLTPDDVSPTRGRTLHRNEVKRRSSHSAKGIKQQNSFTDLQVEHEALLDEDQQGGLQHTETKRGTPFDIADSPKSVPFSFTSFNTLGPILLYIIIAYINMAYMTSLPLYFSASKAHGGLELDSRETSLMLTLAAGSKLFTQLFVFERFILYVGSPVVAYRY